MQSIAVVVGSEFGYLRGTLRGIRDFAQTQPMWVLNAISPAEAQEGQGIDWRPDGIIAHQPSSEPCRLATAGVPMVSLYASHPAARAWVGMDDLAAGRLAARELLDRGFGHFAFVGIESDRFSLRRLEGFTTELQKAGCSCSVLELPQKSDAGRRLGQMERFLHQLPKPAGLLANDDVCGRWVAEVCLQAGLHVPEEVAILAIGNDDLVCDMAQPTLSSIEIPWRTIGFEAAAALHRLIGGRAEIPSLLVGPVRVVTRQSSDILAIDDADVAEALRYLRLHFHEPLGIEEVIQPLALTRRSLERRFRKVLRRSPLEELQRLRIERVCRLLADSDMSIDAISTASGFAYPHWMGQVFRRHTGLTPTAWRRQLRRGAPHVIQWANIRGTNTRGGK